MSRLWISLSFCTLSLLSACGGGTASNEEGSAVNVQYPPVNRTYPYNDVIKFDRQETGDVLSLSDYSLWYITGDYSAGSDATNQHNVMLYEDNGQFGDPTSGSRSSHYLDIHGSTRAFYLEYVPNLEVVATDVLPFHREGLGSLIALSDGYLWLAVGEHSSGQDILGTHDVTIYSQLSNLPNIATSGRSAEFYLHAQSASRGFYIEPIPDVVVERDSTASFNRETVGDLIRLNDGSFWEIVGEHSFGYDARGEYVVVVYTDTDSIPDPTAGQRSDNYLYIYGSSAGFFVVPI